MMRNQTEVTRAGIESKPWVKHYDPGVPATLSPYPDATLLDVIAETAGHRPNHPALLFKGARISVRDLECQSADLGAGLTGLGVKKGDRVATLLVNCPQAVVGQLAIWKAGAIAVPMNPLYTGDELEGLLTACGAEVAIAMTPFYEKLKSLQGRTKLRTIIATSIKEYLPAPARLVFALVREKRGGHRISLRSGDVWWQSILKQHAGSSGSSPVVGPDDPAILLFSGGTTGVPKGALGTHRALLASGMQLHAWFAGVLRDWHDVLVQVLPFYHVYGNAGIMATSLIGRNPLALVPDPRDRKDVIRTIRKTRAAFLPGVPTFFAALSRHRDVRAGNAGLGSLKLCISGASPLPEDTRKGFERLTGCRMIEGYGLTESMMAAIIQPALGERREKSAGLPLPDVDVCVADLESGEISGTPGRRGEILMRAPQLMLGYYNDPDRTRETVRDGWLYTGDIGYIDQDGYVFIVERKKDLIKAGGFQVWPGEIEEVIGTIPAVAEVAVAGVPDEYRGETPKAWIVRHPGQNVTEEDVLSVCRERLAAYKVPTLVEFRDRLPQNAIGKVLRRALVEEHRKKTGTGG